jgi:hypothetical protein
MEMIRKMFAEAKLSYLEGTNRSVRFLMGLPVIGKFFNESVINERNSKKRTTIGILYEVCRALVYFIRKLIYVFLFVWVPCQLMAMECPLIASNKESAMLFIFFMLTSVCGSIANSTVFELGDRDYLMVRIVLVNPYMNFLGKLVQKIMLELVCYTIILCIFNVSFSHSLLVSLVTVSLRPLGEMIAIIGFEHIRSLYENRNVWNGAVIAISVLLAYGLPLLKRRVKSSWLFFVNPVFAVAVMFIGVFAMYYLWSYQYYRKIMREAVHIKREV